MLSPSMVASGSEGGSACPYPMPGMTSKWSQGLAVLWHRERSEMMEEGREEGEESGTSSSHRGWSGSTAAGSREREVAVLSHPVWLSHSFSASISAQHTQVNGHIGQSCWGRVLCPPN